MASLRIPRDISHRKPPYERTAKLSGMREQKIEQQTERAGPV
jgi:hypothetical protein